MGTISRIASAAAQRPATSKMDHGLLSYIPNISDLFIDRPSLMAVIDACALRMDASMLELENSTNSIT